MIASSATRKNIFTLITLITFSIFFPYCSTSTDVHINQKKANLLRLHKYDGRIFIEVPFLTWQELHKKCTVSSSSLERPEDCSKNEQMFPINFSHAGVSKS